MKSLHTGRTPSPCKDCPDRSIGCHSSCEKYLKYVEIHDKERAEIHHKKRLENLGFGAPYREAKTLRNLTIADRHREAKVFRQHKK